MRLPTWEELSSVPEQLDVLEYPLDQSLFVVGPPGSGKTVLAMRRAGQVAELEAARNPAASSVEVVTFNRMLRRLLTLMNEGGVAVSTMQSQVWRYYKDRVGEPPPSLEHDQYAYLWNELLARLEHDRVRPNLAHLVVDEGQDLPQDFFSYAHRHVTRTISVFADDDQALRKHRTTLEDIQAATGLDDPVILHNNHRNSPEIARLGEHFHRGRLPAARVLRRSSGDLPRLVLSRNLVSTSVLVSNWCQNRGGSIGVIVSRNNTGRDLHRDLDGRLPGRRVDIYENQEKNEDTIDVTAPGVTILNRESVKGQEFDTVFIVELEKFIPCGNDATRRAMYMMCTRARDHLFLVFGPRALTAAAEADLPGPAVLERTSPSATDSQVDLFPPDDDGHIDIPWMGIVLDHRRLFDALQDGWLRPLPERSGVLIGVGAYAIEHCRATSGHPVFVRIKLDPTKLPTLDVEVRRQERWESSPLARLAPSDEKFYWEGAVPAFAFSEFLVASEEQRIRLTGLARQIANVDLPEASIRVGSTSDEDIEPDTSLPDVASRLVIPSDEDAIRGAMTMAIWAVPRIEPWLDILTASLSHDRGRLPELTDKVDAGWWRFPPWAPSHDARPCTSQESLWLAAVEVFREAPTEVRAGARELAERIADAMPRFECSRLECHGDAPRMSSWLDSTLDILRASSTIRFADWQAHPVEIALQLVLARPEPANFRTWFKDQPDLAPAIGWSAAALCGLLHGYRRLDTQFRGDALQQEILAIHALHICADHSREVAWPCQAPSAEPHWRRTFGDVVLSWGDRDFARKPEKARGKWHAADFQDAHVVQAAENLAKTMDWKCTLREMRCKDVRLPFSGPGSLDVRDATMSQIHIEGDVRIRLSPNVVIGEVLDVESFRRLIAVEAVHLPEPPNPEKGPDALHVEQLDVPGLTYARDFLSPSEEKALVEEIDRHRWVRDLSRRVQHYGWRYNYKARRVEPSDYLGPLPKWAEFIADRLVSSALVPQRPDQLIVNEYVGNQGISKHSDSESFAEGIATISLLESWEMKFRKKPLECENTGKPVGQVLARRSVAVMSGDSRWRWTHEIPGRKTEPDPSGGTKRNRRTRKRRISLTFRKVIRSG